MDSDIGYKNIYISDEHDHEEVLSTTEVDESLMGDEKPLQDRRISKTQSCMDTIRSFRWILDTSLLLIIIGLLLLIRHEWAQRETLPASWQVGGDYTGAGPIFPTHTQKFTSSPSFAPLNATQFFDPSTLTLWNTLMPPGTGLPAHDLTHIFFTTSMTHQPHCVYMMARIFSGMVLNTTEVIGEGMIPEDWHFHFMHCVDYMRQAVMCGADLAEEPHEPDDLEAGKLDAAWGARHVCKDYGAVTRYLGDQILDGARVVLPIDD
ncbi:hypothetical protein ONS95_011684 [Cadophora gregata]|uniref:uncharacterized protein n=1 Tax=Cadophora gregata TaxID=51156 RepID=UPI0026DB4965|nr:uncharacterized protein ONS95_011684 [Cadophora gregata]KAK0120278.1 hypothetical protein ONS95_011684 [Cadophora gregata]KAK0121311.1 hypothetical protein ONS96_011486 [Cadophora gregata f. sp. sojae]